MRTLLRLLPFLLLLPPAACSKDSGRNSVWLAVTNETGRTIRDFTLDFGKSSFKYQIFGKGYTYGGYARVSGRQSLTISYTDDAGARQAPNAGAALSPEFIGGRVLLTLRPDGSIGRLDEPRRGPPPGFAALLNDYSAWIVGALCLLGLPPFVLFLRKTTAAAQDAGARLKGMAANIIPPPSGPKGQRDWGSPHAVQKAAAEALGLARKVCPVRMFSNDSDKPEFWYEGTLDDRMVGLLDHGRIWVGAPDEETWYAFERGEGGAFIPDEFFEGETPPVYLDPELPAMMARFSSAVTKVGFLSEAAEAMIDWARVGAESVPADVTLLAAIRDHAEAGEPPLLRAVRKGDLAALNAALASHADLESVGISHDTALTQASYRGSGDMVAALLSAGAKAQPENGYPLHTAARLGHLEVVRVFLDAGVPVDTIGRGNYTPLMDASAQGQLAVVELLLSRGAFAPYEDKDGRSALHLAKHRGLKPIVEILRKAGAEG